MKNSMPSSNLKNLLENLEAHRNQPTSLTCTKSSNSLESSTEVTQPSVNPLVPWTTLNGRDDLEISGLVDRLVDTWCSMYGHKFMGKNSSEFEYISRRKGWEWCCRPFSEETLLRAVDHVIREADTKWSWPPSPMDFYLICKGIDPHFKKNTHDKPREPHKISNFIPKIP